MVLVIISVMSETPIEKIYWRDSYVNDKRNPDRKIFLGDRSFIFKRRPRGIKIRIFSIISFRWKVVSLS